MTARLLPLARPLLGTTLPFALPIGLSAFLLFTLEPLVGRKKSHTPGAVQEPGETPSHWLVASRDPSKHRELRAAGWTAVTPSDRPFTDDHSNLLRYLYLDR